MKSMKSISTLTTIAMLTIGGGARAEIWSAGPAYPGNPTSGSVTCRIFNAGLAAVTVTARQIFDNGSSTPIGLSSDTCAAAVPPLGYCAFAAPAAGNFAYSCRVITNGADDNISGVVEVRALNGVSAILPLRK
ncbi:MAG: hypothetical protein JO288_14635 [Hyphomicrobiales bacterium]|nr:hypothetical protein [Hyphomicrobiales bacterium]